MDHDTLAALRERHPAWRLLVSPHAPLIASFLHRVFVTSNVRAMAEADLVEALEDDLYALREPVSHDLVRLDAAEAALYDELRFGRIRLRLRLEQERIGFGWLNDRLNALPLPARTHVLA